MDNDDILSRVPKSLRARVAKLWTPRKLEAMKLQEILDRLSDIGVDGSEETFLPLTESREEAWDISKLWLQSVGRELSKQDDDFLGLAACELWKRYCPERPSMEMLEDWMQDGYRLDMSGQHSGACDQWRKVWHALRERMTPSMQRVRDAEPLFRGSQFLFNWLQDFQMALSNAAADEPALAEEGVELCSWFLDQFPDEGGLTAENFRCELALFLFRTGRSADAEQMLFDFIAENPRRPAGYAHLADSLAYPFPGSGMEPDFERGIALLEKALALPVDDPESMGMEDRLEDMRKDAGR